MLKGASFVKARIVAADLLEAKFYEANLEGAHMSGVRLRFAVFQDAWMKDCTGCPSIGRPASRYGKPKPASATGRGGLRPERCRVFKLLK